MKKNVSFKINKSAFFDGFTSFSLFPKYERPSTTVAFNPWKKVQESFRTVETNIGNIIYEQTKQN